MSFSNINYYVDMPLVFVDEVMELVELTSLSGALVDLPEVDGLSTEQRKRSGYNPAAWMIEVTSSSEESRLGIDIAEVYWRSRLFQQNRHLIETLSKPSSYTKYLSFPTKYSKSFLNQFLASLWKQNLSYWRNL
ncbi:hypothetical protein GIB67_011233 [Kingdonia uniflora]|uniref:Uncharacterized protein n=1 Tax=Kingdonia uniflora TaxID=39325 RepID=A0A7J7M4C0_9MAGN|nr:hypothetical protein GIB67_011233 [Kingdonia uniflora]